MAYEISDFQKEVIEHSFKLPVLVDFWAEWCGPCRMLAPTLERLAEKHKGKWALAKVNTDVHQHVAEQYSISSIPAVKLFVGGDVVDEFVGALPESQIELWLKKAIPSKNRGQVKAAAQLFEKGKMAEAQKILEPILKEEPDNTEATVVLAQTVLYTNPKKAQEIVRNIEADSEFYQQAESIREFGRLFEIAEDIDTLPNGIGKKDYVAAINSLKKHDFDSALQKFVEVIRNDRYYDDDGARKACIAIFKYLGETHDITMKHRKIFNRALY
ncbi:thioredoxin [Chloroherpeton thalassium ATCC 35110]|uniref:Thioredoxin n=1 Tax=Chloroherpeton thalassium (strain ATCC 35110 / GB-78) TaxID=517418 RepID=B3QRW6_CHLT3|nr:thioredoxin [Chloroherpeton thalassium]ACF13919.1 thioredoxin [Chloroherpeton thalassium ATCC 35110]